MSKIIINGVLGIAINQRKQVFLTQRNDEDDPEFHKKWNIPGGGLEWGELPEQTLMREMKEELNVIPCIIYPYPIPLTSLHGDAHILLLCYIVDLTGQTIDSSVDPDHETLDSGWFTLSQIESLDLLPNTLDVIKRALELFDQRAILSSVK